MNYVISLSHGIGDILQTTPLMKWLKDNGHRVVARRCRKAYCSEICDMVSDAYDELIEDHERIPEAIDKGHIIEFSEGRDLCMKMPVWQAWFAWHGIEPPDKADVVVDYPKSNSPTRIVLAPCVKPKWVMKKWPHWNELISRLPNCTIVGQEGDGGDLKGEFTDLRGKTSLRELAGLLADADFVIAEEGGIAHLSCAVGTKTYVLYGGTSAIRAGKPNNEVQVFSSQDFDCRPCQENGCFTESDGFEKIWHGCQPEDKVNNHVRCLDALSVDTVLKTILDDGETIFPDPILISFGTETPREYAIAVEQLREDCQRYHIECDISLIPAVEGGSPFEKRLKAIHQKPMFIKRMILKHKRPVMWFDVDGSIHGGIEYPALGDADILTVQNQDLKRGNADKLRMSGGLIIYPYKKKTFELLDEWDTFCRERSVKLGWGDHRTLEKGILEQGKYNEVDVTNHFANKWLVNSRNANKSTTDNKVLGDDLPKIVVADWAGAHLNGWLQNFTQYLGRRGFAVEAVLAPRIAQGEWLDWWKQKLKGAAVLFVWNGAHPIYVPMIEAAKSLGIPYNVLEVGWFPQKKFYFSDPTGINCRASIIEDDLKWVGERQFDKLDALRAQVIGDRKWNGGDCVLVPLQLQEDMNWQLDGGVGTMQDFITHTEERFAGKRIIFKKHPLDHRNYTCSAEMVTTGDFLDLAQNAALVYGVNSTCLLEACLMGVPVISVGGGYIRAHESQIQQMLAALADKQIPVSCNDLDYWFADTLAEVSEDAHGHSELPWAKLKNSKVFIIWCQNCESTIGDAIELVKRRMEKNAGILVIDNCSDDDTAKTARLHLKGVDHLVVKNGFEKTRDTSDFYCDENASPVRLDMTERAALPGVSVVVSCFNQLDVLPMFLESMFFQRILPNEVIVADDGSTDGVGPWIEKHNHRYPFPIRYVSREHDGYRLASLENMGAKCCHYERILFTNADVVHCPESIESHLNAEGVAGGVVKGIATSDSKNVQREIIRDFKQVLAIQERAPSGRHNLGYIKDTNPQVNPIGVWGGNFSVPKGKFDEVGGFDEEFKGWGGEDNDLARRLTMAGCKIGWVMNSIVVHLDHENKQYALEQKGSSYYLNKVNNG